MTYLHEHRSDAIILYLEKIVKSKQLHRNDCVLPAGTGDGQFRQKLNISVKMDQSAHRERV